MQFFFSLVILLFTVWLLYILLCTSFLKAIVSCTVDYQIISLEKLIKILKVVSETEIMYLKVIVFEMENIKNSMSEMF